MCCVWCEESERNCTNSFPTPMFVRAWSMAARAFSISSLRVLRSSFAAVCCSKAFWTAWSAASRVPWLCRQALTFHEQ